MAAPSLTPNTNQEQDRAYDPAQDLYDREFNALAHNYDDEADPSQENANIRATRDWMQRSKQHVDAHGDTVQSNFNADDLSANQTNLRDKEQLNGAPSPFAKKESGRPGRLTGKVRRRGPTAGVIGILMFGMVGVGGGSLGLAGSLLVNVKEMFHNDRSDGSRSSRLFTRATIANTMNNDDAKSDKPIKRQMSTMSMERVKSYEDTGFKVKGPIIGPDGKETGRRVEDKADPNAQPDPDGSRVKIESIEYPDGTVAKNGKELFAHEDSGPDARRVGLRATHAMVEHYRSHYFSDYLKRVYNFSKGKKVFPDGSGANGRAEQDAAFNRQIGAVSDEEARNGGLDGRSREIGDTAEKHSTAKNLGRGGAVGAVIQGYCSTYHVAKSAEALVKMYHMVQLVRFGLMFMQAADEIKDGRGDGPKTTYLSNNLTYYDKDPNSEKYNLNATDSDGYETAAHGDTSALKSYAQQFVLGGGIGLALAKFTNSMASITNTPGVSQALDRGDGVNEREKMRRMCRVSNSGTAMMVTACAGIPSVALSIGSASTGGIGAAIGAAASITACACTAQGLISDKGILDDLANFGLKVGSGGTIDCERLEREAREAGKLAMKAAKSQFVQGIISDILQSLNINSDQKGVDAGNIIAAAAGLALSMGATGDGLRPAKSDNKNKDITDYITYTQPLEDKYIELAKADAKLAPFDASNKYSLMGSLVRSLNLGAIAPNSLYGNISTASTLLPAAIDTMLGTRPAHALFDQPSTAANGASGRYDHCKAENLKDMNGGKGVAGDKFCSIVAIMPQAELKAASDQAYNPSSKELSQLMDWMMARNEKPEEEGGTYDTTDDCANLDGSDDPDCANSKQASIDEHGKPIKDSQYAKYLAYCGPARTAYWGDQLEPYEQGSDKDQLWYRADQCLKDSVMLQNFRKWTSYCLKNGMLDGTLNCYTKKGEVKKATSVCENGGRKAIYTCALKYDDYGYLWGGGHGDIPNAKEWIAKFNAGEIPKWTDILDCSGLVRVAFVEAMGTEDQAYVAPDGYNGSKYWDKISLEQAEQGDIITQSGHVAIVESNDPEHRKMKIFHASTSGEPKSDNILHATVNYDGEGGRGSRSIIAAYRAKSDAEKKS